MHYYFTSNNSLDSTVFKSRDADSPEDSIAFLVNIYQLNKFIKLFTFWVFKGAIGVRAIEGAIGVVHFENSASIWANILALTPVL
jgi:hypothetical protein